MSTYAVAVYMQALLSVWVLGAFFSCAKPLVPILLAQSASAEGSIEADLADFRLDKLQVRLNRIPPGASRDYLAGLLANRRGQDQASIELLNRALPPLRVARDPREAVALKTLADDYTKTFAYAAASKAYDDLFAHFPKENRGGTRDDAGVLRLLTGVQPMTVDWHGPTRLNTTWNAIGTRATELVVNGVREQWLLDTGANYSVVSKSFAERIRLKILPGSAQTGSGITGIENSLQVGVLSSIQVGGATVHNVVVLIFNDSNLNISIGAHSFQMNAILGFPVFRAMQVITFSHDGEFEAGKSAQRQASGIPMYMRRLTPVVDLRVNGAVLPFTLDTGANRTDLSVRYYLTFKDSGLSWKQDEDESAGAGGITKRKIYTQPLLRLQAGSKTATLKNVPIAPIKTEAGLDELYGNLGQDMFDKFESFTLDFANMRFALGPPIF